MRPAVQHGRGPVNVAASRRGRGQHDALVLEETVHIGVCFCTAKNEKMIKKEVKNQKLKIQRAESSGAQSKIKKMKVKQLFLC